MAKTQTKKILVGISGGIAAYKIAELVRLWIKAGAEIRVCMTESATQFITPMTMQALSGNPVHLSLLDENAEAAMGHIALARWADMIVIAPATANTLAKLAYGIADNLLTTVCLASNAPVYFAPAMNQQMWRNEATQHNIKTLTQRGFIQLGPASGEQACGDIGQGRMLEAVELFSAIKKNIGNAPQKIDKQKSLTRKTVLINAGPTREAIDPVRYISNRSSGKMGYAIAQAAIEAGANVTLVSGPTNLSPPEQLIFYAVKSAQEMLECCEQQAHNADIFIATAAVADYRIKNTHQHKLKKTSDSNDISLELTENPDILKTLSLKYPHLFTVGFAAETQQLETYAKKKLKEKQLNMIAANQVGEHQGFDQDSNSLTVFTNNNESFKLSEKNKQALAEELIEIVAKHYTQQTITHLEAL